MCACLPETAVHVDVDSDTSQVAWSEERKLLEYHRGRGVFYPLIQVRAQGNDLPGSVPAEGGDDHERGHFSTSVAVAGSLFFFFYELGLQGGSGCVLRAVVSSVVLILAVLAANNVGLSHKDPLTSYGLERRLAELMGLAAEPAARGRNQARDKNAVKALSWHPYLNMFAVALSDTQKNCGSEHVAFYDMDAEEWLPTVVKHQFQRSITSLEFQLNSGGNLAVACEEGICLWHFEPAQLVSQGSTPIGADAGLSAWMSWLQLKGYRGTSSISSSPCGRFLAAGYCSSDSPVVWDLCTKSATSLESFMPLASVCCMGGGVSRVHWSPAGSHLLASSRAGILAIYETRSWTYSRHRPGSQGSMLVDAVFSPNGRFLVAGVNTDSGGELWSYALEGRRHVTRITRKRRMFPPQEPTAQLAEPEALLAHRRITQLAWSQTGERLAVCWGPAHDSTGNRGNEQQGVLSLMLTECDGRHQHLRCIWRGLIFGPPAVSTWDASGKGASASMLDATASFTPPGQPGPLVFRPTFRSEDRGGLGDSLAAGALLSVCWQNGRIANYPLYFPSIQGEHNKPPFAPGQ